MTYLVSVRFQLDGIHCWPDAPSEVAFLRDPHRHQFHIKAEKGVDSPDREIEVLTLRKKMLDYAERRYGPKRGPEGYSFGSYSCEQIAAQFVKEFDLLWCEVLEDGENGGVAVR